MKKAIIYGMCLFIGLSFSACSGDEDLLEPTRQEENFYKVPDDATGPEADLRRQFYKDTHINLLFSDVLKRDYIGKDAFGDDVWKDNRIDFNYNISQYGTSVYEITLFESYDDMSKAADMLKRYVLNHFSQEMCPFSILAAEKLMYASNDYYEMKESQTFSNVSCRAISVGKAFDMTDENDINSYFHEVCKAIFEDFVSIYDNVFSEYWNLCEPYSKKYITEFIPDWDGTDMSLLYQFGYTDCSGWTPRTQTFEDPYYDFQYRWFDLAFDYTPEEMQLEFGQYPLMIAKYNALRDGFEALGYKF